MEVTHKRGEHTTVKHIKFNLFHVSICLFFCKSLIYFSTLAFSIMDAISLVTSKFMIKNILFLAFTVWATALFGQDQRMLPYAIQEGTLNEQFTNLSNMSRSQDASFKLIRRTNLDIVRKNVLDSVSHYQKEIATLKANSSSSTSTINTLQDSIRTLDAALQEQAYKTNVISFLGIDFSKGTYHMMVWSIIVVFVLAFIVTLVSFRKARLDTIDHKKTTEELQEDLQALRKKSLEKEQLLKRQLLDEQMKRDS